MFCSVNRIHSFSSVCIVVGIALLAMLRTTQLAAQQTDEQTFTQTEQQAEVSDSDNEKMTLRYWLHLPEGYKPEEGEKEWPLMLFLHGRGECGDDLADVKTWGPPKMVDEKKEFPFILVSPQCPTPGWDVVALKGLMDQISAKHRVDPSRIYITGLSMGGFGTWKFAAKYPEFIAAAIPICGGGDPRKAENLKNVPIWAFHGDADRVVPVSGSQKVVDAIKAVDGDQVKLTVYKGVAHNSWTETYANKEIYEWLLTHQREPMEDDE